MSLQKKLKNLKRKRAQIQEIKQEIISDSSGLFDEFRIYIFSKYPELLSFGWAQFTPYFNDGDVTLFSANTDYLMLNGEYMEESEWYGETKITDWGTWNQKTKSYKGRKEHPNPDYNPVLTEAGSEIIDFLNHFDDDFYLDKFGDHAVVTVSSAGLGISDFDHD